MNDPGRPHGFAERSSSPEVGGYCRDIESYLCRRNGGHLIRIVGPSFGLVSGWAREGVPLKIVFRGIDRYLERQRDRGAARRPARIEFCEHDVRAVFDEWRRAIGPLAQLLNDRGPGAFQESVRSGFDLPVGSGVSRIGEASPPGAEFSPSGHELTDDTAGTAETEGEYPASARRRSLPAHLERVHVRLSSLLASERLAPELLECMRALVAVLDDMRQRARRARGDERAAMLDELSRRDAALGEVAWRTVDEPARVRLRAEAASDLASFRDRMTTESWNTAVDQAARCLLREELKLPNVST